jgi:hypothetical protein
LEPNASWEQAALNCPGRLEQQAAAHQAAPPLAELWKRRTAGRLQAIWKLRVQALLPQMEQAAAWGTQFCMSRQPRPSPRDANWAAGAPALGASEVLAAAAAGVKKEPATVVAAVTYTLRVPVTHAAAAASSGQRLGALGAALRRTPAAHAISYCPLPHVERELALSGLTCASPSCANLNGASEAALVLRRRAGCRVATYCRRVC